MTVVIQIAMISMMKGGLKGKSGFLIFSIRVMSHNLWQFLKIVEKPFEDLCEEIFDSPKEKKFVDLTCGVTEELSEKIDCAYVISWFLHEGVNEGVPTGYVVNGACIGDEESYANCDCSDPENYDFYDEGRF